MSERVKPRRSVIQVRRTGPFGLWGYTVWAPNASMPPHGTIEVGGNSYSDEASARSAAESQARFYDDLERYRVRGVRTTRLKRPVERGVRICEKCGKTHDCYSYRQGRHRRRSWASLEDGHAYCAESWETLARRLLAEAV